MSEIFSAVRFHIPSVIPPADFSVDQWADGLKTNATRINQKRELAVPDEGTFQSKLAERSGRAYQPLVDSGFLSRSGANAATIAKRQLEKIKGTFERWQAKLAKAFATIDGIEAKNFKEQVDESKDHWADKTGKTTLRFTGDVRGPGAVALAVFWITGDNKATVREGDVIIKGSPINVVRPPLQKNLRAGLTQQLTQSGVYIVQTNFDPAVIDEQNEVINDFIKGLQQATYVDFQKEAVSDKSYCIYRQLNGQLYLEIQVVKP